jgi:hypothetical protein
MKLTCFVAPSGSKIKADGISIKNLGSIIFSPFRGWFVNVPATYFAKNFKSR